MPTLHFGPSRVTIDFWQDLVAAAGEGILDEHSYCELKKGLPPPGQNTETARDLASFGVMGGLFIVGIRDAGGGKAGEVVGVEDPHAVKARLVAIADGVIQPSLVCEAFVVEDPGQPGRGCVVLEIPPSAGAPHRADERYWGRGSEGKRVLADPEVSDLFARRRNGVNDFRERLDGLEEDLDPLAGSAPFAGRLFFLAEPAQEGPRVDWGGRSIRQVVSETQLERGSHGWPDLEALNYSTPHPRGLAAQSYAPDGDSARDYAAAGYAYGIQRMVVEDAGRTTYVTHLASFYDTKTETRRSPTQALYERVDHCVRFTSTVAAIIGAAGPWRLGVRLTDLMGAQRNERSVLRIGYGVRYPHAEYVEVVDASRSDLAERPQLVTERLMSPFARGFGESHYFPYESPAEFWRR